MLRRQEYIKANPRVSGRELTNIFNIRLGSAKRLLQKYRGERPAKIRKVMNVETKEIFNSVKLAAISVNGAPANIYVAYIVQT